MSVASFMVNREEAERKERAKFWVELMRLTKAEREKRLQAMRMQAAIYRERAASIYRLLGY